MNKSHIIFLFILLSCQNKNYKNFYGYHDFDIFDMKPTKKILNENHENPVIEFKKLKDSIIIDIFDNIGYNQLVFIDKGAYYFYEEAFKQPHHSKIEHKVNVYIPKQENKIFIYQYIYENNKVRNLILNIYSKKRDEITNISISVSAKIFNHYFTHKSDIDSLINSFNSNRNIYSHHKYIMKTKPTKVFMLESYNFKTKEKKNYTHTRNRPYSFFWHEYLFQMMPALRTTYD